MSEDFGLLYRSTFTGSMVGTSPTVFAVWAYVVANGFGGQVDLNPRLLAATFGTTVADVEAAIRVHCAPDPESRTDTDEGRRLRHVSGVTYEVVNHDVYKSARALAERRAGERVRKRASRDKARATVDVPILGVASASGCDLSQKSVTERDPLLSLSSDLISEGVQGEGDHAPPVPAPAPPEPSRYAPADLEPTPAQRARCTELGHDADALMRAFKRQKFHRTYSDWEGRFDRWIEEEQSTSPPARASSPPLASPKGPPWVDGSHVVLARERGLELAAMAQQFALTHHPPPRCLRVSDARRAFTQFLEAKTPPEEVAA